MVPLMASISGWFRKRLGLGVGLLWATGGIGTAILAPLVAYLIETLGWRECFIYVGLFGGGVMLLALPFIRSKPSDIGIEPYGATVNNTPPVNQGKEVEKLRLKVFNQHMKRTHAFWNLPLIHGLGCAGHGLVLIFVVKMAVDVHDIALPTAAFTITIISLVSIISRLGSPILAELYGPRKIMATSLTIQGLAVAMLFFANEPLHFYVFGAIFGVGFGGEWTSYLEISRRYFGDGPLGGCYGWQMTGAFVGHAVTTALGGLVIYATGSFDAVFALSMGFSLLGVVIIATLDSTAHVLIPDWEESLPEEARSSFRPATAPSPAGGDDG